MGELFRKEWKLCLKHLLIRHMVVLLAGALTGFLVLGLILMLDAESSYIFFGTVFSMIFAAVHLSVIMSQLNTRFVLGVFFGQKRKHLVICDLIFLVMLTVVSYVGILLFLVLEKCAYPMLYSGREAEGIQMFSFMLKWGFLLIALVCLILRIIFTLYMKYNGIVFVILYVLGMTASVLGSRFSWAGVMIARILLALSALPVLVWVAAGMAIGVFIVLINSSILMKIDVKY